MTPEQVAAAQEREPKVRAMLADLNAARDAVLLFPVSDEGAAALRALAALEFKLGGELPPVHGVWRIRLGETAVKAA